MEIEFNTSRVPKPGPSDSVARRTPLGSGEQTDGTSSAADLETKLKNLPLVRPDKVEAARIKVAGEDYPPNYVLDRLAVLLAINLK